MKKIVSNNRWAHGDNLWILNPVGFLDNNFLFLNKMSRYFVATGGIYIVNKKKSNIAPPNKPNINISLSAEISRDELKQLIIEAYFEIEKERKNKKETSINEKKPNIFKIIFLIIFGKHDTGDKMTTGFFFNDCFFYIWRVGSIKYYYSFIWCSIYCSLYD